MSKNTRWSTEDFKKAGLIEVDGEFVKASSQVAKKVDKLPNLLERAIQLPPDYLNTKQGIGIVTASGTTGMESLLPLIDKMQKTFIKASEKHIADVVKAEQERAANPNRPFVYREAERLKQNETLLFTGVSPDSGFFGLPDGGIVNIKHIFDIAPCAAPRMTRRDKHYLDPFHPDPKKRQRKVVTKYFGWKTAFTLMAKQQGYALTEVLRVIFIVPMPAGLSEKKKDARRGEKHQIRPDTDNYTKAIKDSFGVDDGFVWDERSVKVWGDIGQIIIF